MSTPAPSLHPASSRVRTTIPGEAAFLSVLRAVGERAAHMSGFSQEGADEVSLVIDEAALVLLEISPTVVHMDTLIAGSGETKLTTQLHVGGGDVASLSHPDGSARWQVITALTVRAWLNDDRRGIGMEFRRR